MLFMFFFSLLFIMIFMTILRLVSIQMTRADLMEVKWFTITCSPMSVAVFNPLNQFIDRPKNFKIGPIQCKTSNQSQLIFRTEIILISLRFIDCIVADRWSIRIYIVHKNAMHNETAKNKCSPISFERVIWDSQKHFCKPLSIIQHKRVHSLNNEISTNASNHFRMNDLWWRQTREAIKMWNDRVLR